MQLFTSALRNRTAIIVAAGLLLLSSIPSAFGGETPALIKAAKANDLSEVERLLAKGVDPDVFDRNRNTALIFAARDGQIAIAGRLLAAGADVNWQDGEDVSPLILASYKNHPDVALLLLRHGADPALIDQWGRKAIDYALRRGADDSIALMIAEAESGTAGN